MSRTDDIRRKRVLYRAQHRGFKEADLVFGGFAAEAVPAMSLTELDAFERLLDLPDHDLYAIVMGEREPPDGFSGPVLDALIARRRAKGR